MPDRERVIYDIERCICHVPDACRDCSKYIGAYTPNCMEQLLADALALLNEQKIITRCKNCIWWEKGFCKSDDVSRKIYDCGCYPDFRTDPDWFCADAERR